jgi:hypothetical protein
LKTVACGSSVEIGSVNLGPKLRRICNPKISLGRRQVLVAKPGLNGAYLHRVFPLGRQRARAIWFHGLFSMKNKLKPSLVRYHRNQCFSALQVEGLCAFVRYTMDNMINTGTPFYRLKSAHKATLYVFLLMEVGTRRIVHCNITPHPTAAWTLRQLREAIPTFNN